MKPGKTVFKYTDFSILDFITGTQYHMFKIQAEERNQTLTVYKRKHPARVGEWGSGASDADFQ